MWNVTGLVFVRRAYVFYWVKFLPREFEIVSPYSYLFR